MVHMGLAKTITSDFVEAHSLCPRKAFLLMAGVIPRPGPHPYELLILEQAETNRQAHRTRLAKADEVAPFSDPTDLASGRNAFSDLELSTGLLQAHVDFLTKVDEPSNLGRHSYQPVKAIGTCKATKADALGLSYQGLVLGDVQGRQPASGTLIRLDGHPYRLSLTGRHKEVRRIVDTLRAWADDPASDAPPVVLNKHCPSCPFRDACLQQAEKEDNLSLLDRMTPKLMRKYHDKGIFTVRQLSHIYSPRRSRKKVRRQVRHILELQALAIRTGKIHVVQLPELPRGPVELVVDLEGVPDRDVYYLAGLLVCKGGETQHQYYWADDTAGEAAMWSALVERLKVFPDAPVYHYGNYEKKAFATLAKRHGRGSELVDRLVNVASFVYGKVYFPVRSNGLKQLGRFLGAQWTDPQASGMQSLVWRHRWEAGRDELLRQSLIQYNHEDCMAVRILVDRLGQISREADSDPTIDFASRPKQTASEVGREVHLQFERILRGAEADVAEKGLYEASRGDVEAESKPRKRGAKKGHQGYRRIVPTRANQVRHVQPKRRCPKGHGDLILVEERLAEKTITDLAFTRSGCRKVITRYEGKRGFCPKCKRHYDPPAIARLGNRVFGHAFQAWSVYQRIVLRLPYRIIAQVTEHLFGIGLSASSGVNFLRYLASYYAPTEEMILQAILKSNFIHIDETKINIEGVDHYVWVFTDGMHVLFRMTQTREADIAREVLAGYQGVLVSDFYPGYDGVPCRQQKCLVHLIRDINDDLWKAPFDKQLEAFAVEVQSLLVPILEAVDRFGLKTWHLRKFNREVDQFYRRNVIGKEYRSEPAETYRKRFERYRDSLFTFINADGIPWENNMAERAIRQLAVQRKISGSFFKRSAGHYLVLLAISQTCRFQEKSFLKFLLSREADVDSFRHKRPIRYSYAVEKPGDTSKPPVADAADGAL